MLFSGQTFESLDRLYRTQDYMHGRSKLKTLDQTKIVSLFSIPPDAAQPGCTFSDLTDSQTGLATMKPPAVRSLKTREWQS